MKDLPPRVSPEPSTDLAKRSDLEEFETEARHALSGLDLRLAQLRAKVRACERHLVDACRVALCRVDASTPAALREDLIRLHEHQLVRLDLSRDRAMNSSQEMQRATEALIALVGVIKDWQRAIDCADAFLPPSGQDHSGSQPTKTRAGTIRP